MDVVFYLSAVLVIHEKRYWYLLPVVFLATMNRETGGLIPFLLLPSPIRNRWRKDLLLVFISTAAIYCMGFVLLRIIYAPQETLEPYGISIGYEMLVYNGGRRVTWENLFGMLHILPIIALADYQKWPQEVKHNFWIMIPLWVVIHAFFSIMAETRLFLVPSLIVMVPGALSWSIHAESGGK